MPAFTGNQIRPDFSPGMLGAEARTAGTLSVLVVDDAPGLRTAIAEMLSLQGGHAIREAATYLEAVALLDDVDAVTTDGYFPYREGEESGPWGIVLARLVRAHGKRVVLVSADGLLVERAQHEGIHALMKPGGILQLVDALAEAEASPS